FHMRLERGALMAEVKIPDALKADVPKSMWGKILAATPVVMTVIATMLAGLASSEMTKAQYSRAVGAQQQSKTGDQWAFFQARRLRSAIQGNTLDLLQTTADVRPLDATTLAQFAPPAAAAKLQIDPAVQAALDAQEAGRSDKE